MDNKIKLILRKIVEKFYEEFIDGEELSDDMKKERLLDICNKLELSRNQASHKMIKNIKFQLNLTSLYPLPMSIRLLMSLNNQFKLMTMVT